MTDLCVLCGAAAHAESDTLMLLCPTCSGAGPCRTDESATTHVYVWNHPGCVRCGALWSEE